MSTDLAQSLQEALRTGGRALSSAELAVRLRRPRPEVEDALEALRGERALVVREWPIADPHFGMDRILVAAWVADADDAALRAAEERCQRVYDDLLRDFLASHRCV